MEIEDAMGNTWQHESFDRSVPWDKWTAEMKFFLPTNETLKVRFSVAREKELAPEETWTVEDVLLPAVGQFTLLTNATVARDDFKIRFRGISGGGVSFPGFGMSGNQVAYVDISPMTAAARDWRLAFLGGPEGRANPMRGSQFTTFIPLGTGRVGMGLNYAVPGIKAKFVFGLRKAITVEFMARAEGAE